MPSLRVFFKDGDGKGSWAFYITLEEYDENLVKRLVCGRVGFSKGRLKVYMYGKGRRLTLLYDGELNCYNFGGGGGG